MKNGLFKIALLSFLTASIDISLFAISKWENITLDLSMKEAQNSASNKRIFIITGIIKNLSFSNEVALDCTPHLDSEGIHTFNLDFIDIKDQSGYRIKPIYNEKLDSIHFYIQPITNNLTYEIAPKEISSIKLPEEFKTKAIILKSCEFILPPKSSDPKENDQNLAFICLAKN